MQQHHELVLATASAAAASPSTREQIQRYGPGVLAWCEERGAVFTEGTAAALRAGYLGELDQRGSFGSPQQRKFTGWIVNRLAAAAQTIAARTPAYPVPERARTRLVDSLVPDTTLDRAVQQLLEGAPTEARRAVLRHDVALFLTWCRADGREPTTIQLVELDRYRAWIRARGRKAEAPLVAARRIVRVLNPPTTWW